MTNRPRLVPVAPTRGSEAPLSASPFWVGTGAGCGLRLHLPGVAERHVALLEREDGIWLVPVRAVQPAPRLNGSP
ncbi:MAG TPA: FHA domain-containing protein, partial [Longimicrobium sp.]|nr:FHA domain-containing protein [Longimicrobium sp.]